MRTRWRVADPSASGPRESGSNEVGMVTAEAAVLAPVVVLCLAIGGWIISLAHLQVRLIDASRDTARLVARGIAPDVAVDQVKATLHREVVFRVTQSPGGYVTVRASGQSRAPLPGLSWRLEARSTCVDESP